LLLPLIERHIETAKARGLCPFLAQRSIVSASELRLFEAQKSPGEPGSS
jgi:hypothetical protein